jgi:ribosomal protein S18 acetylase RimI-like enzyme
MIDHALLQRIEEAGINASATSRSVWYDGWLVRFSPGKAQRARAVYPLSASTIALPEKLHYVQQFYAAHSLPLLFRSTSLHEQSLDIALAALGLKQHDDTRVMSGALDVPPLLPNLPQGYSLDAVDAIEFAESVGQLRGSPPEQRAAHAKRLADAPLPAIRCVITHDGQPVCAGQCIREATLVGLYDIITAPAHRKRGLASLVSRWLLSKAHSSGARHAYLQVDADNTPARNIYQALGLEDRYSYWYRINSP